MPTWDAELTDMLAELSATQDELLLWLAEKRRFLSGTGTAESEHQRIEMQGREARLLERLQNCHDRRTELLSRASNAGLPGDSIRSLAASLPNEERGNLGEQVNEASAKMQLLRHHSIANWVLAQRALVHLSQMIEIIATGGRLQPTYDKGAYVMATGNLVDQAG